MNTEESNKNGAYAADDNEVSRLLGALKRVEAPANFNFRVKSRIESGRPISRSAFNVPLLVRYLVPAALLLVVAYFGLNALRGGKTVTPNVAVTQPAAVAPAAPVTTNNEQVAPPANEQAPERALVQKPEGNSPLSAAPKDKKSSKNLSDSPAGFSHDEAVGPGKVLLPRGLTSNSNIPISTKGLDSGPQLTAKELLSILGIKAAYDGSGWKVESADAAGMAGRSGVKAGDVIESINDQAITDKTTFGNKFNGHSIRVRRDGASVTVVLKN